MKDVLAEAGIEVTQENKKQVDQAIHHLVDVEYKNCSPTWKEVKTHIKNDETARKAFIQKLKQAIPSE
jgi:hypothetical protein